MLSSYLAIAATIMGIIIPFGMLFQTYKIIKTKSSKDVSLITYIIFEIGVSVWFAYGLSIGNIPLMIGNFANILCGGSIVIAYFIYRKR